MEGEVGMRHIGDGLLIASIGLQKLFVDGETSVETLKFNSIDASDDEPVVDGIVITLASGSVVSVTADLGQQLLEITAHDADAKDLGKWTLPA
jgi:hypothetical protein